MISENLSPEVLNGLEEGVGIVPKLANDLLQMRSKLTKEHGPKLAAVKAMVNAFYGFFSFSGSRLYDRSIGERVTEVGRKGLTGLINKAKELDHKPIYADTDSIMIQVDNKNNLDEIVNQLNS